MIQRPQPYIRQIHVCINNRNGESPSCGYSGSEEVVEELRKVTKERNLKGKIRVVRSGCLDVCAFGPNMMIWPEGLWYMKVTKEDVPQIVDQYHEARSRGSGQRSRYRCKIDRTSHRSSSPAICLGLIRFLHAFEVEEPRLCVGLLRRG